ncbi:MAG: hypothetical protein ACOC32_01730 [Nanoarchaeota archaeon]
MNKLVLFIAFILVAAIGASVLVQTATTLQNQALTTGRAVQQMVSTKAVLMDIDRDAYNSTHKNYEIQLKIVGDGIKFDSSLLSLDELELTYIPKNCTFNATYGYNESTYTIKYLLKGSRYQEGYLFEGDIVKLCFLSPRMSSGMLVSDTGIPTRIYGR